MKRILTLVLILTAASACRKEVLPEDNWYAPTHKALEQMIRTEGTKGKQYDKEKTPYAVFDCDNTSIINDVEITLLSFQMENLRFKISPDRMTEVLGFSLEDTSRPSVVNPDVSVRELIDDIVRDYEVLYRNYIGPDATMEFGQVSATEEYFDFRAKLYALSYSLDEAYGYLESCKWPLRLFTGMTEEELRELTAESLRHHLASPLSRKSWESPDGKIKVTFKEGLAVPVEIQHLYRALQENGIDVYIVSASCEPVVETLACDPEYGLGLPKENVFAFRHVVSPEGLLTSEIDHSLPYPAQEGKSELIRKVIAPLHGGRDPVLVAGDSNGDYSMLTSFPGMKTGLLLNVGNKGGFGSLVEEAMNGSPGRYIVQGRSEKTKSFIPSPVSE